MSARSVLFGCISLLMLAVPAWAQVRVATWNVAAFRGEEASIFAVIDSLDTDDHSTSATPVSVIVLQEVQQDDFDILLAALPLSWSAATYTNTSEDNYGGAQACFYRADQLLELPTGHDDLYTGAGRRCDRWQFRLVNYSDPVVDFFLYSAHLKAGTGSANEEQRLTGANRILEDIAKLPPGTPALVCGDMNLYDNGEPAYQAFVDVLHDALGTGSWGGGANAIKHTQSPRTVNSGGLASGGLDDRFDFIFEVDGFGLTDAISMLPTSMRSVGNDGNHYNDAINDGNNTYFPDDIPRSNALANHLHDASDHLPVMADYRLPAVLATSGGGDVGTVIVGAEIEAQVTVVNAADPSGAHLDWASDAGESGTLAPGDSHELTLPVDLNTPGEVDAQATLSAEGFGVQHSPLDVSISGTVLDHAVASLAAGTPTTWLTVPLTVTQHSGDVGHTVPLWNHGWHSLQARLDVDAVTGGLPEFVSGPSTLPQNIAGFPAALQFTLHTDAMNPGSLFTVFTIEVSDEDLPGESSGTLGVTFNITVEPADEPCIGDVDGNGAVDVGDLLALLDVWGTDDADADITDDGVVNIDDLLMVISDWGC